MGGQIPFQLSLKRIWSSQTSLQTHTCQTPFKPFVKQLTNTHSHSQTSLQTHTCQTPFKPFVKQLTNTHSHSQTSLQTQCQDSLPREIGLSLKKKNPRTTLNYP